MPVTVTEIWRYPVKSMGGERLDNVAVDERGMVADRMWAVRDPELGSITTARRRPTLLRCAPATRPIRWGPPRKSSSCCPTARRSRAPIRRCMPGFGAGRQRGPARADTSSFR
jgi:uncharacterized protein YcbX